jgi:hypothetical protein
MDVSDAVDSLFAGVVPERIDELKAFWGEQADRVRLLAVDRFLLQMAFGSVQISEVALRQIWLTGYAAWRAVTAYNVPLALASMTMSSADRAAWRQIDTDVAAREDEFAELFKAIHGIATAAKTGSIDAFPWPAGVPHPEHGLKITDPGLKGTFDLVCMAGAYVFAHEVRHYIYEAQQNPPEQLLEEETECDRWALALMLDQAGNYAVGNGWPPELVRAKRILGVVIAQLAILALTPRTSWEQSDGHPPVRDRIRSVLDAATDPVPMWFWTTVASMLLGFASQSGVSVETIPVTSDMRQLAYTLCDRLQPA